MAFDLLNNNSESTADPEQTPREEWVFYVVTVSFDGQGSLNNLYRDGELVQSETVDGVAFTNPGEGEFHVGATLVHQSGGEIDVFGRRTAFKGMLDDLRIYDRVLTENEINALFIAQ